MALSGNTWGQLLNQIAVDFARTDLVTTPTPQPSDLAWIWATQAVQDLQPRVFVPGQSHNQWTSTIGGGLMNYYALPPDFESDYQILQLQFGYNFPLMKCSEGDMNSRDIQYGTPIRGQAQFYSIYATAQGLFSGITNIWQPNFQYSNLQLGSNNNAGVYYLIDSNGNLQALSATYGNGRSNATQPVWSNVLGGTCIDGSTTNGAQWTCVFLLQNAGSNPVLRIWPWPDRVYAMTCIYTNKIPVPTDVSTSNFWTTDAEACIRSRAEGLMRKNLFHEPAENWQVDMDTFNQEYAWLSGRIRQTSATGRARACYL